jgi:hypothetical protein
MKPKHGGSRRDARLLRGDEFNEDAVPGYRNYVVYTDESGMHGAKYYGFGSLWIPWERRGDFQSIPSADDVR